MIRSIQEIQNNLSSGPDAVHHNRAENRSADNPPVTQDRQLVTVVVPGESLASGCGQLNRLGQENMEQLARILHARACTVEFEIAADRQLDRVLACIQYLLQIENVPDQRMSWRCQQAENLNVDDIRMVLRPE